MVNINIFSFCAVLLILGAVCITLKEFSKAYALVFSVLAGVFLLNHILLSAHDLILNFEKISENTGIKNCYLNILLKILGICTLVQFTSNSLKDAGESCLAFNAELLGKFLIVYVSFPVFLEIINLMVKLTN